MLDPCPPPPGFTVSSTSAATPIVLASPHSGRSYPAAFRAQSRLSLMQLRRAEDAYVDELLSAASTLGIPLVAATYGRAWLDLNRAADELDPAMFAEPMPHAARGDRVAAGLGILPRIAAHGLDIYSSQIGLAEARERIAQVHTPYHAMLTRLLHQARARHGFAILLDCHSMPSPPASSGGSAQIVLGDLHGNSAGALLVDWLEAAFTAARLRVWRNAPYAGGFTTEHHAAPMAGIHVVQIEIDRALYMDPRRLQRHDGFETIAATLTVIARAMIGAAPALELAAQRQAAE